MMELKDKEWLRRVLEDCFQGGTEDAGEEKNIKGFRILVTNLVRSIEENLTEIQALWEVRPESEVLRERFSLVKKSLFYLRRFCQGRTKGEFQKKRR